LLFISENTIKYHLKIIYEILDIEHRFEIKWRFYCANICKMKLFFIWFRNLRNAENVGI
jgi:hypothetical protein